MLASYAGRQVDWRGYSLHADTPPAYPRLAVTLRAKPSLAHSRDTNDR
jgi:hypothetical protein